MKKMVFFNKFFLFLLLILGNIAEVLAAEASDDDGPGCQTYQQYLTDGTGDNFLLKSTYELIAKVCSNVVDFSWNSLAQPLQVVIALGGAIYIAFYTLKNIGTFSQQDVSAYLTNEKSGVILVGVKTGAVIWLLGNQSFLYKYIVGLAVSTGMEIGSLITGNSGISGSADNVRELFKMVIEQIQIFNNEIYSIVATGQSLLCLTFLPDSILDWHFSLLPFGLVLYIYGWMILLSVSFYMLDVLFRLGVACMVLPLAIACGFSKLTSTYTKKTWDFYINVAFNFIMLGLTIQFTKELIAQCVIGNAEIEAKLNSGLPLNDSDAELIVDALDGAHFVLLTFCCLVAFKLFMEVEQIVDKISSTSSVGKVGQQTGAALAKPVVAAGKTVGKEASHLGGDIRRETGKTIKNSNTWVGKAIRGTEYGLHRTHQAIGNAASKTEGFLFGTGRNAHLNVWKRIF